MRRLMINAQTLFNSQAVGIKYCLGCRNGLMCSQWVRELSMQSCLLLMYNNNVKLNVSILKFLLRNFSLQSTIKYSGRVNSLKVIYIVTNFRYQRRFFWVPINDFWTKFFCKISSIKLLLSYSPQTFLSEFFLCERLYSLLGPTPCLFRNG